MLNKLFSKFLYKKLLVRPGWLWEFWIFLDENSRADAKGLLYLRIVEAHREFTDTHSRVKSKSYIIVIFKRSDNTVPWLAQQVDSSCLSQTHTHTNTHQCDIFICTKSR